MKPPLDTSLAYKYFVAYRLYDGQRFDEVVIPYRPKSSFQKKIRGLLQHENKIFFSLIALCLAMAAVTYPAPPLPFLLLIVAAALSWCFVEMYTSMQPTHFGLSAKGLRFYWIRWFGDKSSPYIPWSEIQQVRLRSAKDYGVLPEFWIDFVGQNKHKLPMSLRLDGIVTGEQRKRLHMALKRYVVEDQVGRELHDILNPVKVDSYTTLWLEVLATSPLRINQDTLVSGQTLANDRYEVVEEIGSGGQGVAYLGRARSNALYPGSAPLNVVLKEFVLPYHGGLSVSKKALDNIRREADLLRELTHPQIVKLVDLFVEDQRSYLVLEHIEGHSLKHLVEDKGAFDKSEVIKLGLQMCDILSHLHDRANPILHRDFTPENLILSDDGQLKLIDFNVAQLMQATATRTVVGKHSYIPPEQFRGKATPQSDIYALGASLYFLLTGQEPEPITTAHPKQVADNISAELDSVVATATAIDTDIRFKSVAEVKAALEALR